MTGGDVMKLAKVAFQTPAELEAHIRERMDDALLIPPNTTEHREIMQEIAKLRIYADAKRWLVGRMKQEA
jgi:hypothetical protein